MIKNGKTLVIDCGGNNLTFNVILSPRVGFCGFSRSAHGLFGQEDFRKEVVVTRGNDDGGGARVAARVWLGAKLTLGGMGEVHRSLYSGVGGVQKD
jgi:hypothetical protein